MSTKPDENTIHALSEAQVQALGGWGDVLTWLRWLREKREFIKPIMDAFDDFTKATTWDDRLAAIGRLMDALGALIATAPTAVSNAVSSILAAEDAEGDEWIAGQFSVAAAEFQAAGIDWPGLIGRLPQLIAFIQAVAEIVRRFRAPAVAAAVVVPPIHGLVYRQFPRAA